MIGYLERISACRSNAPLGLGMRQGHYFCRLNYTALVMPYKGPPPVRVIDHNGSKLTMEAIGIIASIAQLTRYALSLITAIYEIHGNIRNLPALQHQRLRQIERLLTTVQALASNSTLGASAIREHLEAITLKIIDLKSLLEKSEEISQSFHP